MKGKTDRPTQRHTTNKTKKHFESYKDSLQAMLIQNYSFAIPRVNILEQ